ncbi:MAG: D-alanine--D-alanine ligase [Fibrobacteres bacterium]|nr:D-alanine--D-alanine ligase [Fibrobacterota bacterium]
MNRIRVAVIMGGRSGEHPVSLKSGSGILNNLDYSMYAAVPVVILQDGRWLAGNSYTAYGESNKFSAEQFIANAGEPSLQIPLFLLEKESRPDIVFPIIHGKFGEDGALQGLLEMHDLPYVGSGVLGSAVAMHKRKAKELYIQNKIPTPDYSFYSRRQWRASTGTIISHIVEKLGLPVFIKSPEGGSSIGMGLAKTREALKELADSLFQDSDEVLFEKSVKGTEVSCGVLENADGELEALLPTEIVPVSSSFFDYKAKYEKGASKEITPARISESLTDKVRKTVVAAHQALGCRGLSRTDIIIVGESLYVLETNTLPGFTETSLLPQGAKAVGIGYSELLDRILRAAMNRS